ncbi:threonine/serine exporter family protein [Dactylosporangium sp. NPDC050688]|uniref:threonine/serine exporter family protein n=1 Tax=Dactylosporangium sp. NPDC050688 TaxID=3157217 RepID=UPI0033FB2D88
MGCSCGAGARPGHGGRRGVAVQRRARGGGLLGDDPARRGLRLSTVDVDVTFDAITVCCRRGPDATPVTTMRVAQYRTTDLTRLTVVTRIVDQVAGGRLSVADAAATLTAAITAGHPYRAGWPPPDGPDWPPPGALMLGGSPLIGLTAVIVTAGAVGGVGWAVFAALTAFAHFGPVLATGTAGAVVGVAAGIARRSPKMHPQVMLLSGIIPLLPGFAIYRGFYQLATQHMVDGMLTLTLAATSGLALAAGVAFGDGIAGPRRHPSGG